MISENVLCGTFSHLNAPDSFYQVFANLAMNTRQIYDPMRKNDDQLPNTLDDTSEK